MPPNRTQNKVDKEREEKKWVYTRVKVHNTTKFSFLKPVCVRKPKKQEATARDTEKMLKLLLPLAVFTACVNSQSVNFGGGGGATTSAPADDDINTRGGLLADHIGKYRKF